VTVFLQIPWGDIFFVAENDHTTTGGWMFATNDQHMKKKWPCTTLLLSECEATQALFAHYTIFQSTTRKT
jgi:hypothetical protein